MCRCQIESAEAVAGARAQAVRVSHSVTRSIADLSIVHFDSRAIDDPTGYNGVAIEVAYLNERADFGDQVYPIARVDDGGLRVGLDMVRLDNSARKNRPSGAPVDKAGGRDGGSLGVFSDAALAADIGDEGLARAGESQAPEPDSPPFGVVPIVTSRPVIGEMRRP